MLNRLVLFAVLALALVALPVSAQEPPIWVANVYDRTSGLVTRLAPDGRLLEQDQLPSPEPYTGYGYSLAVNESLCAYVVFQMTPIDSQVTMSSIYGNAEVTLENPEEYLSAAQVVIYDRLNDVILGTYAISTPLSMEAVNAAAGSLAFVGDGARVIVASYAPESQGFEWRTDVLRTSIVVLDLTGTPVAALEGNTLTEVVGVNCKRQDFI